MRHRGPASYTEARCLGMRGRFSSGSLLSSCSAAGVAAAPRGRSVMGGADGPAGRRRDRAPGFQLSGRIGTVAERSPRLQIRNSESPGGVSGAFLGFILWGFRCPPRWVEGAA